MLNRQIQYFDEPFRYAVIDNFFSDEDLDFVNNKLNQIEESKNLDSNLDTDKIRKRILKKNLHNFAENPDERFAKYFKLLDSLDIKNDPEKDYTSEYAYFFRVKKLVEEYPVHTENIYKAISLVVYLSEEQNFGTELYDNDKKFVKEVEWKYNRAFVMSGFNNQKGTLPGNSTWHTYKTKPGTLRKTFFGYTVCSKESIKNHSLYKDYYVDGWGNKGIKSR